jgi:hypothetical protein
MLELTVLDNFPDTQICAQNFQLKLRFKFFFSMNVFLIDILNIHSILLFYVCLQGLKLCLC